MIAVACEGLFYCAGFRDIALCNHGWSEETQVVVFSEMHWASCSGRLGSKNADIRPETE